MTRVGSRRDVGAHVRTGRCSLISLAFSVEVSVRVVLSLQGEEALSVKYLATGRVSSGVADVYAGHLRFHPVIEGHPRSPREAR
jgi:hypothetical protein